MKSQRWKKGGIVKIVATIKEAEDHRENSNETIETLLQEIKE
jgi:hypothetical protein